MMIKKVKSAAAVMLKVVISFSILFCIFMSLVFYCNVEPFKNLRTLWVTTAMSTFRHQWLATKFIPQAEIDSILNENKVVSTDAKTDATQIKLNASVSTNSSSAGSASVDSNADTNSISDNNTDINETDTQISVIDIKGKNYVGKLMIVDDPAKIKLGCIDNLGKSSVGLKISDFVKKYNAAAGINASGFQDDNGKGNGGTPMGIVVSDGKVLYYDNSKTFNIAGFDYNNKLITGLFTYKDIAKYNIRDAVSFGPALIINGEAVQIQGDGGSGLQLRTAIGQTADGKVLMLEIDGRQPLYSVGASIKDIRDIMLQYGAVNASNLDGGSSTAMYYTDKVINKPCGPMGSTGGRYIPTAFLVMK